MGHPVLGHNKLRHVSNSKHDVGQVLGWIVRQHSIELHPRKVQAALRYKRVPFTTHDLMPGDVNGDWQERGFGDVKPKVRINF